MTLPSEEADSLLMKDFIGCHGGKPYTNNCWPASVYYG